MSTSYLTSIQGITQFRTCHPSSPVSAYTLLRKLEMSFGIDDLLSPFQTTNSVFYGASLQVSEGSDKIAGMSTGYPTLRGIPTSSSLLHTLCYQFSGLYIHLIPSPAYSPLAKARMKLSVSPLISDDLFSMRLLNGIIVQFLGFLAQHPSIHA